MIVTRYLLEYPLDAEHVLWINTITGAIDVVGPDMTRLLDRCRAGAVAEDEPGVAMLRDRGYLFDSRADEERVFGRVARLQEMHRASRQINFVICPTYSCNLRCYYCYEPLEARMTSAAMTVDQVHAAFAAIRRIRKERTDMESAYVTVLGGEPLLPITREPVAEILRQCAEHGLPATIISNGTHADQFADVLLRHRDMTSLQITLDGPEWVHDSRRVNAAGHGTFRQIARNITWLLENGFRTSVRLNLDRHNTDAMPEFFDMIEQQGWHRYGHFRCQIAPVTDRTARQFDTEMPPPLVLISRMASRTPNLAQRMHELRASFTVDMFRTTLPFAKLLHPELVPLEYGPAIGYCEATRLGYYVMGPDGCIYPCTEAIAGEAVIGRFWPEYQIDAEKAGLWYGRTVLNMEGCSSCAYALICGGGCPLSAMRAFSTPRAGFCEAKAVLRKSLDHVREDLLALVSDDGGKE